jgi:hypothetical protein
VESRVALRRVLDRFPQIHADGTAHWAGAVIGRSAGAVPVRV